MIRSTRASATLVAAAISLASLASTAEAAGGGAKELMHPHFGFEGVTGHYDKEALQRGYQVYRTICSSCHSMKQLSFRNLGQKGAPFYLDECPDGVPETTNCSNPNDNPIVKAIAAEYQVQDGPDDYGDMFDRPGVPSDPFPRPYPNEQIARLANNGALPPDMSLLVKARHHGAAYIYSLMQGYAEPPASVEIPAGQYYNEYYPGDMSQYLKPEYKDAEGHPLEGVEVPPGGVFAMSQPLYDGMVDYADEEMPETIEQYAKDVVEFLTWASEPKLEERKKLGVMTVIYLVVLCGLLYASYREIWSKVDH
ncbi:MAG: cytochrome c1 [Alphaproteobacteria bacterium]|nr:cytochrome c1 [Alphaproteobacteria bacterium]